MKFELTLTANSLNTDARRPGSALLLKKSIRINGIALDLPWIRLKQGLVHEVQYTNLYKFKMKLGEDLCNFFYFIIKLYEIEKRYSQVFIRDYIF